MIDSMASSRAKDGATRKAKILPLPQIVIAPEGMVTEPEYFTALGSMNSKVVINILEPLDGSDPIHVLKRMRAFLKQNSLGPRDEAWIVVDQDKWTDEQFNALRKWEGRSPRHHLAISTPRFESWLALHLLTATDRRCFNSLVTGGSKHIPQGFVNKKRVEAAIQKAKQGNFGNAYQLAERILNATV